MAARLNYFEHIHICFQHHSSQIEQQFWLSGTLIPPGPGIKQNNNLHCLAPSGVCVCVKRSLSIPGEEGSSDPLDGHFPLIISQTIC